MTAKSRLSGLATFNKQYGMYGAYQNHAGELFGASVWDLWLALKDLDPNYIGCQYDIRHAMVEGADTWPRSLELLRHHVRMFNIKDFEWQKVNGKWDAKSVPVGQGMVNFKKYLEVVKQYGFAGPVSMHYEYPLGGAEEGARKLSISRHDFFNAVKRDLDLFKSMLRERDL